MVQAVLGVQRIRHALFYGLDHHNAAVEAGLLVHVGDYPVRERPQEVTLAELYYALGAYRLCCRSAVECFHRKKV